MAARWISLLIGYFCGCFLTAEAVAGKYAGKSAAELGDTGNPGMANIMASLGFLPGIVTLAGDILKCAAAAGISLLLFHGQGPIVILYAGLGCTLGHDFPFWRGFRGGKGVATTCTALILYSFPWGAAAALVGMFVVFATKYLCVGGPCIPLSFTVMMLLKGQKEAAALGAVLTVLSFRAHASSIRGIRTGRTKRNDVPAAIRKKFGKGGAGSKEG